MTPSWANPDLLGFACLACGRETAPADLEPVCGACGRPLVARYDLAAVARRRPRDRAEAAPGLWRHRAVLPFAAGHPVTTLGEGGTPLLDAPRLAQAGGVARAWVKDEAGNPTQSFKARGLALALNGAAALGRRAVALPSAGNAGSAAAAYAAALGMRCRIAMPEGTPAAFRIEQEALGAEVLLVPGTLSDAGRALAEWAPAPAWWNVATFREPFRLQGKKTLGYEIAEQLGGRLPDAVLYPTGGGTGLVGMWRAFAELIELGWAEGPPPRLFAVQVAGCAPVARAVAEGRDRVAPWEGASTAASGLCVPAPFADDLILAAIRDTGGGAIAVSEEEMLAGMARLARATGCFACPEGGATLAALPALRARGDLDAAARVVLFNTGSGLKYLEAWRAAARAGPGAAT